MLIDHSADLCAESVQPDQLLTSSLINLLKTIWSNNTNFFRKCPYPPGEYYLKDWNFSASDLPNVIPAGRYMFRDFVQTGDYESIFNTSTYFSVSNYGTLDMNVG